MQLGSGQAGVVPERSIKVEVKLPPKFGADEFFVELENGVKIMFPESEFWRFEAGDRLVVAVSMGRDSWAYAARIQQVCPVAYQSQEVEFDLGYVSKPRKIGNSWLYMANLGQEWLHVDYSLAAAYFTRGEGLPLSGSYYAVLGVGRSASRDEIKAAWRRAMRRYHPDVYHGEDAHELALRINEAYVTLLDAETRQQYDCLGTDGDSVKRWPGNGFGRLKAVAELRGETWIVRRLLGFARRERRQVFDVPLSDVCRGRIHVRAIGRHVPAGDVPVGAVSARVTMVEVVRGGWSHRGAWERWEEKEIVIEWQKK